MEKKTNINLGEIEEKSAGVYVHKFKTPFTWEGRTFESMTFNFARLTGRDSIAVSGELESENKHPLIKEWSVDYQVKLAARACREKVGSDILENLPILDFNRICYMTRSFFVGLG